MKPPTSTRVKDRRAIRSPRATSGLALVWTVMGLFLFIAVGGLALDTGYVYFVGNQLQNAADAAALAGAQKVREDVDLARQLAHDVGYANKAAGVFMNLNLNTANLLDGDIVVGTFNRSAQIFTPGESSVNAVKVTARRTAASADGPVALVFGPIFGVSTSEISRSAIAMTQGGAGAGVIVLNPSASCSFDMRGTPGSLEVNGGGVYVDSSHPQAACHSGDPTLAADALYVTGATDGGFENQAGFAGDLFTGVPPIPDPLAGLPEPAYNPATDLGSITVDGGATINAAPGYYAGGFNVRNGTLNLLPGVYILGGVGLDNDGGNINANGVMFFIVETGSVNFRGNGTVTITPPETGLHVYPAIPDIAPYATNGVSIFQARGNANGSRILATNQFHAQGTFYFPAARIELGGTSDHLANGLIADTISVNGDGAMVIHYDDRFPPISGRVFLVK